MVKSFREFGNDEEEEMSTEASKALKEVKTRAFRDFGSGTKPMGIFKGTTLKHQDASTVNSPEAPVHPTLIHKIKKISPEHDPNHDHVTKGIFNSRPPEKPTRGEDGKLKKVAPASVGSVSQPKSTPSEPKHTFDRTASNPYIGGKKLSKGNVERPISQFGKIGYHVHNIPNPDTGITPPLCKHCGSTSAIRLHGTKTKTGEHIGSHVKGYEGMTHYCPTCSHHWNAGDEHGGVSPTHQISTHPDYARPLEKDHDEMKHGKINYKPEPPATHVPHVGRQSTQAPEHPYKETNPGFKGVVRPPVNATATTFQKKSNSAVKSFDADQASWEKKNPKSQRFYKEFREFINGK